MTNYSEPQREGSGLARSKGKQPTWLIVIIHFDGNRGCFPNYILSEGLKLYTGHALARNLYEGHKSASLAYTTAL